MQTNRNVLNKENVNPSIFPSEINKNLKQAVCKDLFKRKMVKTNSNSNLFSSAKPIVFQQEKLKTICESNPQNVVEFSEAIRGYLQHKERVYQISASYMDAQIDINPKMRAILIDWLIDVNLKFKLIPATLFLTVNLIDRFLSKEPIERSKIQLVGISCLMIVGKFEEIYPPMLKDYISVCDNAYSREQIMEMESRILLTLNFDLAQTSSYTFLQQIQLGTKLDEKALSFAKYIIETVLFDLSLLKYNNFEIAAGATFLVHKIFRKDDWKKSFEEKVGLSEKMAKICSKDLFKSMQLQDKSPLTALKRKFMSPEFHEVSKYRIEKVSNSN